MFGFMNKMIYFFLFHGKVSLVRGERGEFLSVKFNLKPSAAVSHYVLRVIRAIRVRFTSYICLRRRVELFVGLF